MITLKQALKIVKAYKDFIQKGSFVDRNVEIQEEYIRTAMAKEIARANPPLDPDREEDLLSISNLPQSTVLSETAEAHFNAYRRLLQTEFGLRITAITSVQDIKQIYQGLQKRRNNLGPVRSWRQKELQCLMNFATCIANQAKLQPSDILQDITNIPEDIELNEAAIHLANSLFDAMEQPD